MFDQERAEQVLERLAQGETLSQICRDIKVPRRTVHNWRRDNPVFEAQFARAKDEGFDAIADDVVVIADDGRNDWMVANGDEDAGWRYNGEHATRSRLRVETRLKLLAKWDPKRYGDRVQLDADMRISVTVNDPFAPLPAAVVSQQSLPAPGQSPCNSLPMAPRGREGVGEGEIVEAVSQVPVLKSPPYPIA